MKEKTKKTIRKCLSLLFAAVMLLTVPGFPALAETTGQETRVQGASPANPVHHCTKQNDGTDTTDWSYVYFGSYPQTEVTGAALTAAITGAAYDSSGDAWVDGIKYRRISKDDTNYQGYFGDSEYRYFKWERIKWRVLQNNGETLFVVADKGLDCKNYHEINESVTWENCTLREWLNSEFYSTAFSSAEQGAIVEQTVVNEDNPYYGTEGGNETTDSIFLLSIGEVTNPEYGFCEEDVVYSASRFMQASGYAHAMGAYIDSSGMYAGNCWWWLRSPGYGTNTAALVYYYGNVHRIGYSVNDFNDACVPALHINLTSDLWSLTNDGSSGAGGVNNLFNEYLYRADHLVNTEEHDGYTMEKDYINTDTPSKILLRESQSIGFSDAADAWRAVTRVCDAASDASKIADYAVEEKDIYEAIILNALESAAKYDVVDTINADVIKEANELLQVITCDLKENYAIDIYDSTQNSSFTQEMRVRTKELAEEYYEQKNISKVADWLDNFEKVMGYLDTAEDFCEELASYVNIRNMNDSMKSVLKEMKKNCPSSNKALASALDDCVDILDASDSEFAKQVVGGGLKTVGTEVTKAAISKFWEKIVVAKVEQMCPRVVIVKAAYQTSKYLTNLLFNTDEITEKYYKMIAAIEFDSLMRDTYASLKNTYLKGKNVENAKVYLSAIDVLFHAISYDCDSAYAFVDSIDSANLNKICRLFGCSANSSSLKESIENIKQSHNETHEDVLTGWVYYLLEDFPEEYSNYTRLFEESDKRVKEYQIHCPVDVYIYDSANKLVASVVNNIPGSSGLEVVVDGDKKTFYLPEDEQYSISYIGNGFGVMDIGIAELDEKGIVTRNVNFNNIPLSEGVKYSSNENGKFLGDAEYSIVDSNAQRQEADFDSYTQEGKEKHTITIEQGTIFNGEIPSCVIEAYENQVLDISAYVPTGYELDQWKISSGSIEIKDINNVNTKIIVGSEDATITAVLKANQTAESPKPTTPGADQTTDPSANTNTNTTTTTKASLAKAVITLSATTYSYDGKAKKPTVKSVKLNGKTLTSGTDYAVSYTNNKNIGTATVTITGKGNYTGTAKKTFKITAKKGSTFTVGSNKYKITSSSAAAFTGLKSAKTKKATIPATVKIGGKSFKVTSVAASALKGKKVTSVTVGSNVTSIGKNAFASCSKLGTVTIKSSKLKTVGKNAFKGIKATAKIKVPAKKLAAYKKLLKGKGQGSKVKITK